MHMFHLHCFEYDHRLAPIHAIACGGQNRNHAAIHRRTQFAIAGAIIMARGCRERPIIDQEMASGKLQRQLSAGAQENRVLHHAVTNETNRIGAEVGEFQFENLLVDYDRVTPIFVCRQCRADRFAVGLESHRDGE